MKYQPQIDGLRALAVIPVILFHAGFSSFQGGFIGVDVFFVISGYLITMTILSDISAGQFSLIDFYERRARRILPALLVVMLLSTPCAVVLMLPNDLENFGQSLFATTLFSNNILLWLTSGYWDLANEFKPLLHTWSLAIEEQYYVIYPLLIILVTKLGTRPLTITILTLGAASFLFACWFGQKDAIGSFMLLPARAWELLSGALLAWITLNPKSSILFSVPAVVQELLAASGLILLLGSVFFCSEQTAWPSPATLVPVFGTLLIIAFTSTTSIFGRLMSLPPVVGIGLISYSLYLWHQPIFAFIRLNHLEEPSREYFLGGIAVTFVVAFLSWRYVEQPFRNRSFLSKPALTAALAVPTLLLSTIGLVFHFNSGFVHRWEELNWGISEAGRKLNASYNKSVHRFEGVPFRADAPTKILVMGNSFARDFINAVLENGFFSQASFSYSKTTPRCIQSPTSISPRLAELINQADYIIYGSPSVDLNCWDNDYSYYKNMGKKVLVIGTKNFGWNLNAVFRLDETRRYSYRARVLEGILEKNARFANKIPSHVYVNVLNMLMDDEHRVPVFTEDKRVISQDREHLTKAGAKYVGRIIFNHPSLAPLR